MLDLLYDVTMSEPCSKFTSHMVNDQRLASAQTI